MNERNKLILSLVRRNLHEIDTSKVTNEDIFDAANLIQTQIMLQTYCVQKDFTLTMVSGQDAYDVSDYGTLIIKEMIPSFQRHLIYVPFSDWHDHANLTGDKPNYYTIFNRKIMLSPVPNNSTDTIKIYAYQSEVITPMDEDTPPEIPAYADLTLIYGVCSTYDPNFIPLFAQQCALIMANSTKGHTMPRRRMGDRF